MEERIGPQNVLWDEKTQVTQMPTQSSHQIEVRANVAILHLRLAHGLILITEVRCKSRKASTVLPSHRQRPLSQAQALIPMFPSSVTMAAFLRQDLTLTY